MPGEFKGFGTMYCGYPAAVRVGNREHSWPEGAKALGDVERALRAAAILRKRPE